MNDQRITARELMIGNKLMIGKYLITVAELYTDEFKTPEEGTLSYSHPQLSGSPLTEEWLLKFGLSMQRKQLSLNVGGELFDFIIIGKEPNAYCLWYCKGKGFTLDSVVKSGTRFIDNVHTLQNFVYALTGEELTIKEPAHGNS